VAVIVVWRLWKLLNDENETVGRRYAWLVILFTVLAVFAGRGMELTQYDH
jgi:hypothetical protein